MSVVLGLNEFITGQNSWTDHVLVDIIFGGFENITIWQRFNLEILLEESGWGPYLFHLVTTNFGKIY